MSNGPDVKQLIFISHATHEDDYFANWLGSKLRALGYEVFVDNTNLRVGDDFSTVIQPKIQRQSHKFIAVNTKSYVKKASDPLSGVRREINVAAAVRDVSPFILPVRCDDVDYSSFPMEYASHKAIDFKDRWGAGLRELVGDLQKFQTPRNHDSDVLALWYQASGIGSTSPAAPERLMTNWFEVTLPKWLHVHTLDSDITWNLQGMSYPFAREANRVITFASKNTSSKILPIISSECVETADVLSGEAISIGSVSNVSHKLTQLLHRTFRVLCFSRGLLPYEQTQRHEVYYFPLSSNEKQRVVSLREHDGTRISLSGRRSGTAHWHFALDAKFEILPKPHFVLNYAVIFTDAHGIPFPASTQHTMRREFSSNLNNKRTMEMIQGAMLSLRSTNAAANISMPVDTAADVRISILPIEVESPISYVEPGYNAVDDVLK